MMLLCLPTDFCRNPFCGIWFFWGCVAALSCASLTTAQTVTFHLNNGDRISGTIVSEETNRVVLATTFAGNVTILSTTIIKAEIAATPEEPKSQPTPASSNLPAQKPAGPESVSGVISSPKPGPELAQSKTNAANPKPPSDLEKFFKEWTGELQVGVNLGFSTTDRQTYTGRFKASHVHGAMKNLLDYSAAYGRTDGVISENQMDGSWKVEYDLGRQKRFHVYNSTGGGYNEIQKIDLRYDVGPGIGYKLVMRTNLLLKVEVGANYQKEYYSDDTDRRRYTLRLAEDLSWHLSNKLKLDEKVEFFPEVNDFDSYRVRIEGNLSYLLRNNMTLNLTVIDLYDTAPPDDVSKNELQIRSSVGLKF